MSPLFDLFVKDFVPLIRLTPIHRHTESHNIYHNGIGTESILKAIKRKCHWVFPPCILELEPSCLSLTTSNTYSVKLLDGIGTISTYLCLEHCSKRANTHHTFCKAISGFTQLSIREVQYVQGTLHAAL